MPAEWDRDVVTYGAKGAKTGAMIGSAFSPGVGTAIGAGVGAIAGGTYGLFQGDSEYETEIQKRLAELKRRQELGALGLTDEEMAAMEAQYIDPLQAARRETGEQFRLAAGQQMDPAAMAKMAIGEEQRAAEAEVQARGQIAVADIKERQREESQIMELMATQEDIERMEEQEMWDSLEGAATSIATGAAQAGQLSGLKEDELQMIADEMDVSVDELGAILEDQRALSDLLSQYGSH